MGRFDYLDSKPRKKTAQQSAEKPAKKKDRKTGKIPADSRPKGETSERLEVVYVRKETVRAVWREVKRDGGESVSELVEDLLLQWLRTRA